ncbi:MAG: DUF3298 domain-containing protein [Afipia sp.]|nr:DUF3298 domain-containing protein [Afipia sp.]
MLAFGHALPARTAEPKPDLAFRTKAAEITVSLDVAIKANGPLAADLLAEGKRWAQKNLADATREMKASPELFREGRAWSFERSYTTQSVVAGRYVSVLRTEYAYTGGAHPNTDLNTILWDNTANKRISIRPFFKELTDNGPALKAVVKAIIVSLKAEKKERDTDSPGDEWARNLEPKLLKIGAAELAPSNETGKSSGLIFNYSPYAVGAYAEGAYEAFVPWPVLKPYLSLEGEAIFGGDRPADAGKSDK